MAKESSNPIDQHEKRTREGWARRQDSRSARQTFHFWYKDARVSICGRKGPNLDRVLHTDIVAQRRGLLWGGASLCGRCWDILESRQTTPESSKSEEQVPAAASSDDPPTYDLHLPGASAPLMTSPSVHHSSFSRNSDHWQLTSTPDGLELLSIVLSRSSCEIDVMNISVEYGALLAQVLLQHPGIAVAFAALPATTPSAVPPHQEATVPAGGDLSCADSASPSAAQPDLDLSRLGNPEINAALAAFRQRQADELAPRSMPAKEPPFTPEGMPTERVIRQDPPPPCAEVNQGSTLLHDLLQVAFDCPNAIFSKFSESALLLSFMAESSKFQPTPPRLTPQELKLLDDSFRTRPQATAWISSLIGVEFCWECRRRRMLCQCPSSPEPTKQKPAEGAATAPAPTSPEAPSAFKKAPPEAVLLGDFSEGYAGGKLEGFAKGEAAGYARAKAEIAEATCPGQFGTKGCTRARNHHGMCVSPSGSEWTGPMMEHRLAMAYECGRQKERDLASMRSAPPSSRELELATAALQITPSGALVLVPHQHFFYHLGFVPSPEHLKHDRLDLAQWLNSLRHGLASVLAMAVKASAAPSTD